MPLAPPAPRTLFGYDVIQRLGEGAGSQVYAVSDPVSKQLFALKHVIRKTEKDARFIEQLENEYNVGRKVMHPNLRRMIDFKVTRTMLRKVTEAALVMELFDGNPLETHLPATLDEVLWCFILTASALAALQGAGFIHCDLKPNNIMLGPNGVVKVIDLGQACLAGTEKPRIQGTPDFISPEQVHRKAVSKATDVYNFGATLYWALTGRKLQTLFTLKKGENSFLVDDAIPTPAAIKPSIPVTLSNFVMDCVRTNPAKRPADMNEVVRRLAVLRHVVQRDAKNPRLN